MTKWTLRTLLLKGLDDLSRSGVPINYRHIENAVKDEEKHNPRGLALNRTTISQLVSGTYKKTPTDGTIRAIAWLASVDEDVAYAAAGRRAPGPPFAAELPTDVDTLAPRERAVALDVLRVLIQQRKEIDRYADLLADSAAQQDAPPKADEIKKTDDLVGDDEEAKDAALGDALRRDVSADKRNDSG